MVGTAPWRLTGGAAGRETLNNSKERKMFRAEKEQGRITIKGRRVKERRTPRGQGGTRNVRPHFVRLEKGGGGGGETNERGTEGL